MADFETLRNRNWGFVELNIFSVGSFEPEKVTQGI